MLSYANLVEFDRLQLTGRQLRAHFSMMSDNFCAFAEGVDLTKELVVLTKGNFAEVGVLS